jgi:hypothetical protein
MPLNLTTNDGDFTPFIKYNAKAGRWYIKVDGQENEVEVTNPTLAFDMDNIKTGWLFYAEGLGPEKVWDPSPVVAAPKPAGPKAFKRGFEVQVSGAGAIGVREFSSTAGSVIGAMLELYAIYEAGKEANQGKVPVFVCTGVNPVTGKYGTNYAPVFKLNSWKERKALSFDGDGSKGGHWSDPPAKLWTVQEALVEAGKAGISREDVLASIKARGFTGWNAARETPILMAMIEERMNRGEEDFPPPAAGPGFEDIPF